MKQKHSFSQVRVPIIGQLGEFHPFDMLLLSLKVAGINQAEKLPEKPLHVVYLIVFFIYFYRWNSKVRILL